MENNDLFNHEAEQSLIGAVLINPLEFTTLGIEPDHFFINRHSFIWQAFNRLYSQGIAIDFVTLCDELDRAGHLREVGGQAFITGLINATPSSLHAEQYAQIVKDFAHRRTWKLTAGKIARAAFDTDSDLHSEAGDLVDELLDAIRVDGAAIHISEYAARVLDETQRRMADPSEVWGIQTGFADFDRITGGLQTSEILDVSGEPGIGKSIFAMQAAFQMAAAGHPGVIYSAEMKGEAVLRRRLSADSKVPTRAIKSGYLDDGQMAQMINSITQYDDLPLYMSDAADITSATLRADLTRLKLQHGIEWFVFDYAFLLRDGENLSEVERTGLISSRFKTIARALDLAGIVIYSMTKEGMNALVPEGQHLRGSAQQYYDADVLIFMIESNQDNMVKCIFGKGRELEKPKDHFDLVRLPGFPALANAATREVTEGR
jgi:replicative DNA helicase